jgi:hypothetical protein
MIAPHRPDSGELDEKMPEAEHVFRNLVRSRVERTKYDSNYILTLQDL